MSASLPEAGSARERSITLHLLVVDDSSAVRQYMSVKLKQLAGDSFGIAIDEAASG